MPMLLQSNQVKDWLLPGSHHDPRLLHVGATDQIFVCPPELGQGYRQEISLREDLTLLIIDYTFDQTIMTDTVGAGDRIEFEFHLAGIHAGYSLCIPCFKLRQFGVRFPNKKIYKVEVFFKGPTHEAYAQSFIERLSPEARTAAERILQAVYSHQGGGSNFTTATMLNQIFGRPAMRPSQTTKHSSVKTTVKAAVQNTEQARASRLGASRLGASKLGPSIEQVLSEALHAESFALNYATYMPITVGMRQVIDQILSCPYQGPNRLTYLKQKSLTLIDLRLNALLTNPNQDYETACIHQAAALLREQMLTPPSLASLARQVGTNRLKLNQGFRALYGTTPFGYLRSHRLVQAKRLLMTSDLSIDQVSHAVGYTSRSRFATAFRQRMGLNPKTFQLHVWQNN